MTTGSFAKGWRRPPERKKRNLRQSWNTLKGNDPRTRRDAIANFFRRPLLFLRNRWRWGHGRCPLCNRDLYSVFPYYVAGYPNCTVCKGETKTNLKMWEKHRAMGVPKRPDVVGLKG